ncbi:hypothetical protein SVI_0403 [Shewanella violacea DSS12]|uniref:Uncharacterized protein n=1 Tax=Shewanella violacea (strain JCM 10179 / CIP 106290 / LMG 19151 / DSS12) TaxID=637905 RepID=D4ZEZ4_SHEVD|nr:hypothetical protein SVI_0403 [Shewanella violacea DSS12]
MLLANNGQFKRNLKAAGFKVKAYSGHVFSD